MLGENRIPRLLPADLRYWDHEAFEAWLQSQGSAYSAAKALGISWHAVERWSIGKSCPRLDDYLRLCAIARVPLGSFLRGL